MVEEEVLQQPVQHGLPPPLSMVEEDTVAIYPETGWHWVVNWRILMLDAIK